MRQAVEQSLAVKGATYPNPPVGAVILDSAGEVAGVGATQPAGAAHAEVVALRAAGGRASGGTAVVTLEPCNHHGRTPPCVDALLDAGVAAVVYAVADPNPAAAGGAGRLHAAGVAVTAGVAAEEVAAGPLREWLHKQRTGCCGKRDRAAFVPLAAFGDQHLRSDFRREPSVEEGFNWLRI